VVWEGRDGAGVCGHSCTPRRARVLGHAAATRLGSRPGRDGHARAQGRERERDWIQGSRCPTCAGAGVTCGGHARGADSYGAPCTRPHEVRSHQQPAPQCLGRRGAARKRAHTVSAVAAARRKTARRLGGRRRPETGRWDSRDVAGPPRDGRTILGDSPANLLIKQGVMDTRQGRRLG
jgi:hypothetical protein